MDNNLVARLFTQWEKGKDYPEFMDEVALVYNFKRISFTWRNTKKSL